MITSKIKHALLYAEEMHKGQLRDDGKPYMTHIISVSSIISMLTEDETTITAAILHDTIEDTDASYQDLYRRFGKEVADIVVELTKTKNNTFPNLYSKKAILIKFADRLSNLSDMNGWTEKRQREYLNKSVFWKYN